MKLQDKSILFWLVENRMKTETGQPIDFREHLYLADIYRDWSPRIVCKKAAQIGFTTAAFLKLCYALDKKKLDAIYTLPTDDEMKVLVGGKFNRLIAQNPVLQQLTKDKDSIEQKQFGDRMAYFRGTWGERQAISHSSDLNVHDEASRSKKDIVELYESRLQHSKFRWQWIFSNPSTKGDITDRYWLLSDQKEWHITCKECDGEQVLTWPESIDFETAEYVCKGCGAPLTVDDRRKGAWRPTGSDMSGPKWSGYHISLLMAPWVSAGQILDYYRNKSAEQFANFVLGEPYVGEGNTITEDIFTRNLTQKTNPQENVVIGCDSGIKKHYVCGNRNGLFHYDVTEDWEDIARLLIRWPRAVAVLDAMPDITGPRALRERFKGRVFLNHYAKDRKTLQLIRWGEGKEFGSVLSDRNRLLQLVIDEFSDSRIPLEGTEGDWADFIAHWRTLFRVSDTDAVGNPTFRWETSNGQDHWCFPKGTKITLGNGWVKSIENVMVGEKVLTRKGPKRVLRSGIAGENSSLVTVFLSDGTKLRCTPDHKIWVDNFGWKRVDAMAYGDTIYPVCKAKQSSTTELSSGVTLTQKPEQKGFIMSRVGLSEKKEQVDYTKKFGNHLTEKFLQATSYITKTAILLTMRLLIWSANYVQNIKDITIKNGLPIPRTKGKMKNSSGEYVPCLMLGERQTKEKNGIARTHLLRWSYKSRNVLYALSAKLKRLREAGVAGDSARKNVAIVGVADFGERENVYSLTVNEEHEYFAEGILVANCHATALWRIGMDRYGAGDGKILKATTKPLIEVQKPFETRKFVQAVTKIDRPTWWDKETD